MAIRSPSSTNFGSWWRATTTPRSVLSCWCSIRWFYKNISETCNGSGFPCNQRAHVRLDHDRTLGAVNKDGPLITDPTRAVLTMDLSPNPPTKSTALDTRPAGATPGRNSLFNARRRSNTLGWVGERFCDCGAPEAIPSHLSRHRSWNPLVGDVWMGSITSTHLTLVGGEVLPCHSRMGMSTESREGPKPTDPTTDR